METTTGTPSGADAGTTEVVSATRAAADAGDVSTFLDADRAARVGKPFEKVERTKAVDAKAPAVSGKGGAPAKGPSAADRDADARLVARIRESVDTATADLRRKLDDAERRLSSTERKPEPVKPAAAAEPKKGSTEYQRFLAMPDAPKAEEFDSIVEHAAAMSVFINDTKHAEREQARAAGDRKMSRLKADVERVKTFSGRIEAFKQKSPDFSAKLSPEVKAMHGIGRLHEINAQRGYAWDQQKGAFVPDGSRTPTEPAINMGVEHAIAEEIYDSEAPAEIAVYLSEHPDELRALKACGPNQLSKAFGRLEQKVLASGGDGTSTTTADKPATPADLRERAAAVVDRSVSKSAPPATTFGKAGSGVDPFKAAIESGDVGMFLELDRVAMAEKRGLRP